MKFGSQYRYTTMVSSLKTR